MLKGVLIDMPTLPNGDFDLGKQKQIAERYEQIENIKRLLLMELNKLQEVDIVF